MVGNHPEPAETLVMDDVQLAHWRRILELSERMLTAGMAQSWDELVSLEEQRQVLLKAIPPYTGETPKATLAELISQIQDKDNVLREKIEVWMTHVRIMLRIPPEKHTP